MYHGEANIYQDDLNDFLSLAENLQLKGLAGSGTTRNGIAYELKSDQHTKSKIYQSRKDKLTLVYSWHIVTPAKPHTTWHYLVLPRQFIHCLAR